MQVLPPDYYKEWLRLPYLTILAVTLGVYWAHPCVPELTVPGSLCAVPHRLPGFVDLATCCVAFSWSQGTALGLQWVQLCALTLLQLRI